MCSSLTGGENSLWGGSFSPASLQHLPRCRWGGAVAVLADGLDGKIKTGDPLSSPFPSDPASAAMHCAPAGHAPRSVSAPMKSRAPAAAEAPRRVRSRGSHIDLADGLETGSPYFHLYSPGLALSRGGSLSCSSSPLEWECANLQQFLSKKIYLFCSERLARCRGNARIMVILGSFMHFQTVFTCLGVWLHLILNN